MYSIMVARASKKMAGGMILGTGLIFGILPFVPGIVLIILGLELLGLREVVLERIHSWRKKSPIVDVAGVVSEPVA